MLSNNELLPYISLQGQVAWPAPVATELEEKARPWPVSLAVQPGLTLPWLVLVIENYNRVVASNGRIGQPQKLLTTTNNVILSPWRPPDEPVAVATNSVILSPWPPPYRPVTVYMNGVVNTFVDITRLKQSEEKLRQKQQQLESLNKNLEELVAERTEQVRRLASEVMITEQKVQHAVSQLLHDELQQILVGIQMQTAMLHNALPVNQQALRTQTREIREAVNLAFQITRQVAIDLAPPLLLHQNLMESLHFLAAQMKERYGLKIELKGMPLSNWPREEVGNLLFQIVRELLFNVVKHAGVNQATVEVSEEDGRLRVEVSDHGQGFDMAAAMTAVGQRSSLGLVSIRNRLELFGGQFHIASQVGQGTRVAVVTLM